MYCAILRKLYWAVVAAVAVTVITAVASGTYDNLEPPYLDSLVRVVNISSTRVGLLNRIVMKLYRNQSNTRTGPLWYG
jgi:hypothetical protein